jgi:hypothetical protein
MRSTASTWPSRQHAWQLKPATCTLTVTSHMCALQGAQQQAQADKQAGSGGGSASATSSPARTPSPQVSSSKRNQRGKSKKDPQQPGQQQAQQQPEGSPDKGHGGAKPAFVQELEQLFSMKYRQRMQVRCRKHVLWEEGAFVARCALCMLLPERCRGQNYLPGMPLRHN